MIKNISDLLARAFLLKPYIMSFLIIWMVIVLVLTYLGVCVFMYLCVYVTMAGKEYYAVYVTELMSLYLFHPVNENLLISLCYSHSVYITLLMSLS